MNQPGDEVAISPPALDGCALPTVVVPGSGLSAGRVTSAAILPASDAAHAGATDRRRPCTATGETVGIEGGDGDRFVARHSLFCRGAGPAEGRQTAIAQASTRRRITGKRKPADCVARGPGGGVACRTNSAPEGGGMHTGDGEAEVEDTLVPEGARQRAGKGCKRTRLAEECDGMRRIGREDRPPARACGEKNTLKSTYGRLGGLGAAGGAAQGAHAAAAVASPSSQCSRLDG
jgi:hypothetical protein